MAPVNSTAWTTFYARNRDDGGTFQNLFDEELITLVDRTTSHFENPDKLVQDVAGSMYGNMMMIPGAPGKMHLLHHGFICNKPGGIDLIFAQGNLGDSFYFKVLPRTDATAQIKVVNGQRTRTTNCPTLEEMRGATTAEGFASLAAHGNGILCQHPNHVLIHPALFLMVEGAPTVRARDMAMTIIEAIRIEPGEEDVEELARKETEAAGLEALLGMLWASENEGLTEVRLSDIEENPTLNHAIRTVKTKLSQAGIDRDDSISDDGREEDGRAGAGAEPWAASTHSIVNAMNKMTELRESEISKRRQISRYSKLLDQTKRNSSRHFVRGV